MIRRVAIAIVVVFAIVAVWLLLPTLLTMLKQAQSPEASPSASPSGDRLTGMQLAGIKTEVAHLSDVRPTLHLTGQVVATEKGSASITVPLQGVVEEPLVKVGDFVPEGQPVAVINSVYGQTGQQALQKIEQDQAAVIAAESALSQAENTLGQTQATLGQARTTYAQALDTSHQNDSELLNSRKDLRRKQRLEQAGVFARSDVDDASERYEKAVSAARDGHDVINFALQGVKVSESNLVPTREAVRLAMDGVRVSRATLERDRAIYTQSQLIGASLPQHLTPVHLGSSVNGSDAAATTEFYVRSPISGTVTTVTMSAGLAVSPTTVLATIVNTHQVYVDANAFESDLVNIQRLDAVTVTSANVPTLDFKGHVSTISRQVDPASRTVAVRSLIQNPTGSLRPAMYVSVNIEGGQSQKAFLLPENAVVVHGDQRYVYIQTGPETFDKRKVTIGVTTGGKTEIRTGLVAGDKVVTEGNLLLDAQE